MSLMSALLACKPVPKHDISRLGVRVPFASDLSMSDRCIAIECPKCHSLNFVALSASSKEFVCVSCGAPLDFIPSKTNNQPPPKKSESDDAPE
jgi:ribosomal protein S27E